MGKDEREANSPSFFNVTEVEVLVDYLTKLLETQGKKGLPKLSATDIGIIAPYRKQVSGGTISVLSRMERIFFPLNSVPSCEKKKKGGEDPKSPEVCPWPEAMG